MGPAGDAGLLFHNPEGGLLGTPHEFQSCRRKIGGLENLIISGPFIGGKHGILVVGNEIQLFCQIEIVDLPGKAHEVMGDEVVGADLPDDIGLHGLEIHDQIGAEALPIQHVAGIAAHGGDVGRIHLGKGIVFLTPEIGTPGFVQGFHLFIFGFQPFPEPGGTAFAHTQTSVGVTKFIVDLPAHHVVVVLKMIRHGGDETADIPPVDGIGLAIVMPPAKVIPLTMVIHRQNIGVFVHHPLGRSRTGGSQNSLDSLLFQNLQGFVQPFKMVLPVHRLHFVPGKFPHTHHLDTQLVHHSRVGFPPFSWPMLGVIVHAKGKIGFHTAPSVVFCLTTILHKK